MEEIQNLHSQLTSEQNYEQDLCQKELNCQGSRLDLIRRICLVLFIQISFAFGLMCFAYFEEFQDFIQDNMILFWVVLALSLMILIPLTCYKSISKSFPYNYILLIVWTLCESYILATCCAFTNTSIILAGGSITVAVVLSLTLATFILMQNDINFITALITCCATLLLGWSIVVIIFIDMIINTIYCLIAVLLFTLYLIYDLKRISRKFGKDYLMEDYVIGCLNLYTDLICICWNFMELCEKKK